MEAGSWIAVERFPDDEPQHTQVSIAASDGMSLVRSRSTARDR